MGRRDGRLHTAAWCAFAHKHQHAELSRHACGEAARKRRGECAAATLSPLAVTAASTSSAAHSSSSCLQQGTVQLEQDEERWAERNVMDASGGSGQLPRLS